MENSKIGWTTHTFNPWWGCVKVSPGCAHCYAEAFDKRTGGDHWGADSPRKFFSDKYWAQPLKWDRQAARSAGDLALLGRASEAHRPRVFCASMADVFEDRDDLAEERERLWHLIRKTPNLDWLLLTKRPEAIETLLCEIQGPSFNNAWNELEAGEVKNLWLGTTVECRSTLHRAETLSRIRGAAVRFLSMEPLLEEVVPGLRRCQKCDLLSRDGSSCSECGEAVFVHHGGIDWVIVGGESGSGARPFDLAWARKITHECLVANVPVFVKQLGSNPCDSTGTNGGYTPLKAVKLNDKQGSNWTEWPGDLKIRQSPQTKVAR